MSASAAQRLPCRPRPFLASTLHPGRGCRAAARDPGPGPLRLRVLSPVGPGHASTHIAFSKFFEMNASETFARDLLGRLASDKAGRGPFSPDLVRARAVIALAS